MIRPAPDPSTEATKESAMNEQNHRDPHGHESGVPTRYGTSCPTSQPIRTPWAPGSRSGTYGPCRVALALTGKGNQSAAVLTERATAEFAPAAVLFVGVAGALQPHLGLGDVVVATHVYAYHGGTSQDDGLNARPRSWELSHRVHQIAAHLERTGDWARPTRLARNRPAFTSGRSPPERSSQYSAVSAEASGCASTTTTQSRSRWRQLASRRPGT